MMSWNNVSPTYHYLDDFRSDDDEGLVRVGFTRSEGSLQIFAVGVSIRRCSWLSYVVMTSTSSLDLLCDKIRFLQLSILVVKDCKSPLLGVFPANVFFQCLLDLIASSKWLLWSSKLCVAMAFACVPYPCCHSIACSSSGGQGIID